MASSQVPVRYGQDRETAAQLGVKVCTSGVREILERAGGAAMVLRWADSFEEGWYFSLGGQMSLWFSSRRWQ